MQRFRQPFQGILVAGQSMAVHKDVKARIFPFNDNVQAGSHRSEHRGEEVDRLMYFPSGNPKHQRSTQRCKITQVWYQSRPPYNESIISSNLTLKARIYWWLWS